MFSDRSSTQPVGAFSLHVDRDHRGRFRGRQAMTETYRGWHYHIDHPELTQQHIMTLLEEELRQMGASQVPLTRKRVMYPFQKTLRKVMEVDKKKSEGPILAWFHKEVGKFKAVKIDYDVREIHWERAGKPKRCSIPKKLIIHEETTPPRYQMEQSGNWVDVSKEEWEELWEKNETVEEVDSSRLGFGMVENKPAVISLWRLDDRETILWISSVTDTLHIEANKNVEYAKSIFTKSTLEKILKKLTSRSQVPDPVRS